MLANPAKQLQEQKLNQSQAVFSSALLNADLPLPDNVVGPTTNKKAIKRFGVYRNNVIVSLTEALLSAFPTIHALLGDEYFRALARVYIIDTPPTSAMLAQYGEDFGLFLDNFEPVQDFPYLGDVARLEFAWLASYNAEDKPQFDPEVLQTMAPEALAELRFTFHPACQLFRFSHAAYSIWAAHKGPDMQEAMAQLVDQPEDVLITRPQWEVTVVSLPDGGYAFVKALMDGQSLSQAAQTAAETDEAFDFGQNLGGLIETGALAGIQSNTQ